MADATQKSPIYNGIPKQVSRKDFNRYIWFPHLSKRVKGPKPKFSFYKIFNYILYVLHTGIQSDQLHWSNVYKWHNRWSKDGSYEKLFEAWVIHLLDTDQLDISRLHGDGSNTVVKKRTFGWQDTYRKLALSYDKLKETRLGFRYLAYSMINFRITFNHS